MKICFFEVEDWEIPYIKERLQGHELKFFKEKISEVDENQYLDADVLSIFIYSQITKDLIDKMPNLKLIVTNSTGFDHIDLDACSEKGIVVCNVPHYGENTVAEHTFALILALARHLIESVERTKRGDFSLEGLRGFDLKGKTLGVVGTGRIGIHVIKIAKGFDMNVIAYDAFPNKDLAEKLGFSYVSYEELLRKSDIITFHVPLLPSTKHMFNKKSLELVKRGVILINTSRGPVVETDALIEGLSKGIIAAAGLDVLEDEIEIKEEKQLLSKYFLEQCDQRILLENHILLTMDNVIVTPHNAFNTHEALQRIIDTTIANIKAFVEGKPQNVVNKK